MSKRTIAVTNGALELSRSMLQQGTWYACESENVARLDAFRALSLLDAFPEPPASPFSPESRDLPAESFELTEKQFAIWRKCLEFFLRKGAAPVAAPLRSLMIALELGEKEE